MRNDELAEERVLRDMNSEFDASPIELAGGDAGGGQAEKELLANEEHHRAIVQHISDIVWVIDEEVRFRYETPSASRVLGYEPGFLLGKVGLEFVHPDDLELIERGLRQVFQGGNPLTPTQFRFRHADGHWVQLEAVADNMLDHPAVRGVVVVCRDITDRERAVTALQESEQKLRNVVDESVDGIVLVDERGNIVEWNAAQERISGLERADVLGQPLWEIQFQMHPKERRTQEMYQRIKSAAHGLLETGQRLLPNQQREWRIQRADGADRYIQVSVFPIKTHKGFMFGAITRDITERQQMQEVLRESEARYRALVESSSDHIFILDRRGTYLLSNNQVCQFGLECGESLVGHHVNDVYPPGIAEFYLEQLGQVFATGQAVDFEHLMPQPDGQHHHLDTLYPILRDDTIWAVGGICRDITERKCLEKQFRQAQKMEAVGRLAGGVAHDFNNILTTISGYTELLLESFSPDDPRHQDAEEIARTADRAAALTRQLLAYSRRQMLQPRVLDLNHLVRNVEQMLRRLVGEDVEVRTILEPDLGHVEADIGQLEQVLMNLVVNARDAMPQGGVLVIETANVELDDVYARDHPGSRPGTYVMLAVSDTGVGMDEELLPHIFEPFFTTKEEGKGTGLGLATVYGIVKQSDGYTWPESEPGRGTTFRIYLPRVEERIEPAEREQAPIALPRGTETVLVVEDEDSVRELTRRVLERQGYEVLVAGHPEEALRLCAEHTEPIHLLLTDVVMPGMHGRELAERLVTSRPETRVLYMSGYPNETITRQDIMGVGESFLPKPFTSDALVCTIREILDRSSEGD